MPGHFRGILLGYKNSMLLKRRKRMNDTKSLEIFENAPVRKAVFQNALPAMAAMLMVLIYNLADTFFIGQTHDDRELHCRHERALCGRHRG